MTDFWKDHFDTIDAAVADVEEFEAAMFRREVREDQWAEIKWNCPNCGTANTDVKEVTAVPYCEGCDKDVHWDEIN